MKRSRNNILIIPSMFIILLCACSRQQSEKTNQSNSKLIVTKQNVQEVSNQNNLDLEIEKLFSASWWSLSDPLLPKDVLTETITILDKISNNPKQYLSRLTPSKAYAFCNAFEQMWKHRYDDWGEGVGKVWAAYIETYPHGYKIDGAEWHQVYAANFPYEDGDPLVRLSAYEMFLKKHPHSAFADEALYNIANMLWGRSLEEDVKQDEVEKCKDRAIFILKNLSNTSTSLVKCRAKATLETLNADYKNAHWGWSMYDSLHESDQY